MGFFCHRQEKLTPPNLRREYIWKDIRSSQDCWVSWIWSRKNKKPDKSRWIENMNHKKYLVVEECGQNPANTCNYECFIPRFFSCVATAEQLTTSRALVVLEGEEGRRETWSLWLLSWEIGIWFAIPSRWHIMGEVISQKEITELFKSDIN